jgi:nucleoside-diphosphate-sugar epimerase
MPSGQGRRVLITGHTGFKGSWLTLALLKLGAEVWGYALPPEPERSLFNALELEQNPHPAISQSLHHWVGIFRMARLCGSASRSPNLMSWCI